MPGLYLHIPFCKAKCRYCDFVSFADCEQMGDYVDALLEELKLWTAVLPKRKYDTVFLGGGTPSLLPEGAVASLLDALARGFDLAPDAEITIESNPGTLAFAKLLEYRAAGVSRLSMGLQSAQDTLLKSLGRIHTCEEFLQGLCLAREAGFDNVNADIMYGLPGQTVEDHLDTIRYVAELGLAHISAYSLVLEETTPLYTDVMGGAQSLPDEDTAYAMHREGMALLESLGYRRYEISNYAKPGYESRHNLNYWNNGEYLGFGLNSHSAMRVGGRWLRWANTAVLGDYIAAVRAGERPLAGEAQTISKEEEMFECVMLGLRKTEGMADRDFRARFGESLFTVYGKAIGELAQAGWLLSDGKGVRLTDEGLDMQNQALLAFLGEDPGLKLSE